MRTPSKLITLPSLQSPSAAATVYKAKGNERLEKLLYNKSSEFSQQLPTDSSESNRNFEVFNSTTASVKRSDSSPFRSYTRKHIHDSLTIKLDEQSQSMRIMESISPAKKIEPISATNIYSVKLRSKRRILSNIEPQRPKVLADSVKESRQYKSANSFDLLPLSLDGRENRGKRVLVDSIS